MAEILSVIGSVFLYKVCDLYLKFSVVLTGVSPDKTPRRSKYVSGSSGNGGGQGENAGEASMQNESSEVTEERLAKLMEEKMQNNGTRNEAGKLFV